MSVKLYVTLWPKPFVEEVRPENASCFKQGLHHHENVPLLTPIKSPTCPLSPLTNTIKNWLDFTNEIQKTEKMEHFQKIREHKINGLSHQRYVLVVLFRVHSKNTNLAVVSFKRVRSSSEKFWKCIYQQITKKAVMPMMDAIL